MWTYNKRNPPDKHFNNKWCCSQQWGDEGENDLETLSGGKNFDVIFRELKREQNSFFGMEIWENLFIESSVSMEKWWIIQPFWELV